jgi:hypothetical protein
MKRRESGTITLMTPNKAEMPRTASTIGRRTDPPDHHAIPHAFPLGAQDDTEDNSKTFPNGNGAAAKPSSRSRPRLTLLHDEADKAPISGAIAANRLPQQHALGYRFS